MWPTLFHARYLFRSMSDAGVFSADEIAATQAANRAQDNREGQRPENSNWHFMRISSDDTASALTAMDEQARTWVAQAQQAFKDNDSSELVSALGKLSHLCQDATSSKHVDQNTGAIKSWNSLNIPRNAVHGTREQVMTDKDKAAIQSATNFAIKLVTGEVQLGDANFGVQLFAYLGNNSVANAMQKALNDANREEPREDWDPEDDYYNRLLNPPYLWMPIVIPGDPGREE